MQRVSAAVLFEDRPHFDPLLITGSRRQHLFFLLVRSHPTYVVRLFSPSLAYNCFEKPSFYERMSFAEGCANRTEATRVGSKTGDPKAAAKYNSGLRGKRAYSYRCYLVRAELADQDS